VTTSSDTAAAPLLEVSGIETNFRRRDTVVTAVRGAGFTLRPGERLGIVGESGCGKSALTLSILGLVEPPGHIVAGEVRFRGELLEYGDERRWSAIRGRHMALVYQDAMAALDPVRRVGDQIGEAIRTHDRRLSRRIVRSRVIELLGRVELPDPALRADAYPHEFSGGMRQRVAIAMALANDPDILIADEPTTALDVTTQAQILELLRHLAEENGSAVVLITHDMGVIAEFCQRVLVMYAGRIVEDTSTQGLFASPMHPYSEALLGTVMHPDRLPHGPLPTIDGSPPRLDALPPGCAFAPRCAERERLCEETQPRRQSLEILGSIGSAECYHAAERAKERTPVRQSL
jgi:oligopeptide/dipeptide ABC transporter ATP-binding protein